MERKNLTFEKVEALRKEHPKLTTRELCKKAGATPAMYYNSKMAAEGGWKERAKVLKRKAAKTPAKATRAPALKAAATRKKKAKRKGHTTIKSVSIQAPSSPALSFSPPQDGRVVLLMGSIEQIRELIQ